MLIDILESRTLFSGYAVPKLPAHAGPQTKADYAAAVSASLAARTATKTEAVAAKAYAKAVATLLKHPTSTITTDEAALKSDRITITAKVKTDIRTAAVDAKALVLAFQAGDQIEVAADLLVLKADYAQIKTDTNNKVAAAAADAKTLADDTNADPTVAPLFATVQVDTTTLTADQSTFATDLAAYKADLKEKPLP